MSLSHIVNSLRLRTSLRLKTRFSLREKQGTGEGKNLFLGRPAPPQHELLQDCTDNMTSKRGSAELLSNSYKYEPISPQSLMEQKSRLKHISQERPKHKDSSAQCLHEIVCRIRVKGSVPTDEKDDETENSTLISLRDLPDCTFETQLAWAKAIGKKFLDCPKPHDTIRPWDLVVDLDGKVEVLPHLPPERDLRNVYPPPYRDPWANVTGLDVEEKVKLQESFALGSLLYEVFTLKKPHEGLDGDEIQSRFRRGDFPEDVFEQRLAEQILRCWSSEFDKDIQRRTLADYIKAHPVSFGFKVLGGVAIAASLIALPVLGAVGFSAAGPMAGSAAAAWQASIGLVEAGSLFAFCQSAAMGGAAVNGIIAVGVTGVGVAGLSTLPLRDLKERFARVVRKA